MRRTKIPPPDIRERTLCHWKSCQQHYPSVCAENHRPMLKVSCPPNIMSLLFNSTFFTQYFNENQSTLTTWVFLLQSYLYCTSDGVNSKGVFMFMWAEDSLDNLYQSERILVCTYDLIDVSRICNTKVSSAVTPEITLNSAYEFSHWPP